MVWYGYQYILRHSVDTHTQREEKEKERERGLVGETVLVLCVNCI